MVGVPLMVPVEVLIDIPVGRDGLIPHVTTGPPELVKVMFVITESLIRVSLIDDAVMLGIISFTTIVITDVSLPPVFVAVTV